MAANMGVLLHCVVAYQITTNVVTALFLGLVAPGALRYPGRLRSRVQWAATTVVVLAYCCLIAYALPYFSDVRNFHAYLCS